MLILKLGLLIAQTLGFAWELKRSATTVVCTSYKAPLASCVDLEFARVHVKENSNILVRVFSNTDFNVSTGTLEHLDNNAQVVLQLNSTVDGNLVTSLNGVRAGRYKLTLQNNPAGFLFYIDPAESWTFSSVNSYRGYAIWPFIVGFGSALILAFGFVVYRKESEKKKLSQHKPSNHEWVPLDTVEWE